MEAEPIVLPDNTVIDTSKPPPGFNFPKPDFSAVISDDVNETSVTEKSEGPLTKPTFKSALQAKKRLQAFSTNRPGSLPSSPSAKKIKPTSNPEEKSEEGTAIKKTPKKGYYHDDKAKAVIEEIEELKREEMHRLNLIKSRSKSRSRSRSRSQDKERFKKVDKKARNYRKRSLTPEKTKKVVKKPKKYPKNWQEFIEFDSTFELNRDFEISPPKGNNELLRQILFESPSLPITPFKMKTGNKDEKIVPFQYIRYTRAKPVIAYSVNCVAIKENFLPRKVILDTLPKDIVSNIENLYSNSLKFKVDHKNKGRIWFPKIWKDSDNECKLLEKSVGLSFLQTYTGEEEENEFVEETEKKQEDEKPQQQEVQKLEVTKEKTDKDESKKKKKSKKSEEQVEEKSDANVEKKKKKKHRKEKKKHNEENNVDGTTPKKRKRKKDKKKKEKRPKEKKVKHKKASKEKKKKEKSHQQEEPVVEKQEKQEKPNKQQVIEELKKIEEKLAKKREQNNKVKIEKKDEKEEKADKERSRKRKHSERNSNAKRVRREKHKKESDINVEVKVENKKKTERGAKIDISELKLEEKFTEKTDKYEKSSEKNKQKIEEDLIKKSRSFEEVDSKHRKKKSRWSEPLVKKEEIDYMNSLNIEEEIKRIDEVIKKHEEFSRDGEIGKIEEIKKVEVVKERTPDTEEYHSHWESDDDITSSSVRHQSIKMNRSWESDEELFERTYNRNKPTSETYTNLEIPLNIKTFSRRAKWEDQPSYVDTITEFKLLEEERRSLSEERRKLEIEKQKILKMQEEAKLELKEKTVPVVEEPPKELVRMRSSTPETVEMIKVKKEKADVVDFNFDSLNNSLLSNVSSTESNFPIAVLENEYEEFIKAVSSDSSIQPKKKQERKSSKDSSSSSSSSSSSDSDHKKKKRKKKKKKKKKARDCLLVGKGNNIFNEFDIPVPSDLPEMVPTPVPVPSPMETLLPLSNPALILNPIIDLKDKIEEPKEQGLDLTKPFVFSSITLPSKKTLLDNSKLNLNDDSDSADFTDKFMKKIDGKETKKVEEMKLEVMKPEIMQPEIMKPEIMKPKIMKPEMMKPEIMKPEMMKPEVNEMVINTEKPLENIIRQNENKESKNVETLPEPEFKVVEEKPTKTPENSKKPENVEVKKIEEKEIQKIEKPEEKVVEVVKKIEEESKKENLIPEPNKKETSKEPPLPPVEVKPPTEKSEEKSKRSSSPDHKHVEKLREKRRSRTRSRDRDVRRRSPARRREPTPPSRRRYSPPRRRSPLSRRRGSPRRRSPSPRSPRRRMLSPPLRRRRRSPSLSPPRSRGGARKRTPSPRIRRSSPLNSPLDGFKRSVADSTISDDMLPQPPPDDYVESPPIYRKGSKKDSISPPISPKRIPLDDRINQVLGLEKNEPPPPKLPPETIYPNYGYNPAYTQQYNQYTAQYGQFGGQKGDFVPTPFGSSIFTQPPPPIVKSVPTPTKVVQVGNILQVVPTEEIPQQNVVENKAPETSQKIVQVGNMLQIVPAVIPPSVKPPILEQSTPKPVQPPEKQSAEAIMKQKAAERKAEREKRRQERERRRKEKEKKRKEKEKRKQLKLKIKTENMIKRAIQLEAEALACEDLEEEAENSEVPVQWPPVSVVVSSTPSSCKGILVGEGASCSKKRKSVQFADGVRPGEGTSPSGGEELSSPPPNPPKLPKEKRYKKLKIPKKSKKKKIRVKVVKKKVQNTEDEEDEDEDDNLPPPSPPPGSPPPHVFPSRVKTHTINNVHQFVGNIIPTSAAGFPFRPPMPMVLNRHQQPPPPPAYLTGAYHSDVSGLSHQQYQGVSTHH